MEFRFAPLKEFDWIKKLEDGSEVFMGRYVPGNTYNCTKEPRHDALREKCKEWVKDKKIVTSNLLPGQAFKTIKMGAK